MKQPSVRAEVITRRTYNRPLNKQGTLFETWEETVSRVISHQKWLWERQQGFVLSPWQEDELEELKTLMLERKVSMSGRTLWLGGTEISKKREASQFNPLKYDTQFVTTKGVRSFDEFEHGDEVEVITHLGNVSKAVVSDAGIRDMIGISLTRGRIQQHVSSCVDHSWILNTGERIQAKDLKIGDKLYKAPDDKFFTWDVMTEGTPDEQLWWCYGFVYGDGTLATSGNSVTSRVRLCGDKAKHLPLFIQCGFEYSFPPSCNEDPFVYTGKYLKTLPSYEDSPNLIKAFLRGYLAADGNQKLRHDKHVATGLATTSKEAASFVHDWLPVFGVYITSSKEITRSTNYGQFIGYELSFTTFQKVGGNLYTVKALNTEPQEQCYCLTVEQDHSFILPSGITTSNCAFLNVETVHDVVDAIWLLMQGCGVGFKPITGTLNGFMSPIKDIEILRSSRTEKGGNEHNTEVWDKENATWTIRVGDSAEAWARSFGKLLAGKVRASKLVVSFQELRPAGERLSGYGWISSGDESIAIAFRAIINIMNKRAGSLLTAMDILDLMNWLGTILSSRRSAEIALLDADHPEWKEFALAKKDFWLYDNAHRCQSNNSLVFNTKPDKDKLLEIFKLMEEAGGSEPGFINGEAALKRAPWFKGLNPCAEILLGNKSFCNLTEVDIGKFKGDSSGLLRAITVAARANYRQTCVNLQDGVLQEAWHLNNEFLRLCGVGLTGIARRYDLKSYDLSELQRVATSAAYSMADELGTQHPKNVTTVKPSGTLSKIMDTPEGVHKPLGKYIFNNVNFSKHDPVLLKLRDAGYNVRPNPVDAEGVLITFPVSWEDIEFTTKESSLGQVEVNVDTAIEQLNRYKLIQNNWTQQNTSVTISYSLDEVEGIIDWLLENWDSYVGVSFIYRADPTKTAKDLGYLYLPQEVVTKTVFDEYTKGLTTVNLNDEDNTFLELSDAECAGGVCPVK